jgi:putative oxidoreductase
MANPKPFIPQLAPVYDQTRDLGWLLVRLTAGGFLLVHGLQKLFGTTITAFAANSMAKRGIEPALAAAYAVWFLETVGALCIMFGFLTRLIAGVVFIELLVIIFVAKLPNGFV